ncbi:hypothetical protein [Hamadaea tsunoensis]|uniref:hypothetical protein n=1 Tax=Hamadaea tsunoensis TaxID=53368 RepID=UPI0012F9D910|nr:hypothetical protein [Hamadaea tsunoensis]
MLLVEQSAKLTFDVPSTCLVMESGKVAMTGTSRAISPTSFGESPMVSAYGLQYRAANTSEYRADSKIGKCLPVHADASPAFNDYALL